MTGNRADAADGTLGRLLYTSHTKSRVSEDEWVGIVRRIAAGDQRALRALYERTHRLVFTFVARLVNDRRTADELTVDIFYELWRRAAKYDPAGGSVLGWIMNQARSRAIDRLRYEQRKKRTASLAPDGALPEEGVDGCDQAVEVMQQGRALRESLGTLTAGEREAIETAFFLELSYAEAAVRLNQPLGTVKTRIRSGLEKLREALAVQKRQP